MCELKKIGNVVTSKFVGAGPSSYRKRIYRAAVSQRLRNTALHCLGFFLCVYFISVRGHNGNYVEGS